MVKYFFRSDGFTVRETPTGMTVECMRCGATLEFTLAARVAAVEKDLDSHRDVCQLPAGVAECVAVADLVEDSTAIFQRGHHER